jgi:tetrahydromethanopterin S-methyltransferase subunit F
MSGKVNSPWKQALRGIAIGLLIAGFVVGVYIAFVMAEEWQ